MGLFVHFIISVLLRAYHLSLQVYEISLDYYQTKHDFLSHHYTITHQASPGWQMSGYSPSLILNYSFVYFSANFSQNYQSSQTPSIVQPSTNSAYK